MKWLLLSVIKIVAVVSFLVMFPVIQGWGDDGHLMVCRIAQPQLSEAAKSAVKDLLPAYADNDLGSLCTWADHIKRQNRQYRWSSPLHFIDTPDNLCNYQYTRDCKDGHGEKDRCVVGAINNYTTQLLTYSSLSTKYNLTEALLFLSHYIGDIHQPLHVGFTSDGGANAIKVHWYGIESNLHHVWDDNIIDTAEERFYGTNVNEFIDAIQRNITGVWANEVPSWERCSHNETTCPDIYASESNKAACAWAYKGVSQGSTLEDDYFFTRLPVVNLRLAQGGVRLAATLNRIFWNDPSNIFIQSISNLNQSSVSSV